MRLKISKSKNAASYYVIKDINYNGKRTTKVVEKLGTEQDIKTRSQREDFLTWISEYIKDLNKSYKEDTMDILLKKSTSRQLEKYNKRSFNGGYLFLEKIYYNLGLNKICEEISKKYKFEYDLNNILSRLIYSRIIYPSSKLATHTLSQNFLEHPDFELQHIYRALEIISKEMDYIQAEVYKNSTNIINRNSKILYYDCTNYYFEIDEEAGSKFYGKSKEHRPNPIIQMGLFIDGNGIPLAFNITPGNTNEQVTLTPLEKIIEKDFGFSKFVVCTDAGLSSNANKLYNDKKDKAYITTQSIKKLKSYLKKWALDAGGWSIPNNNKIYNINDIENNPKLYNMYKKNTFFKERALKTEFVETKTLPDGKIQKINRIIEEKIIITFSFEYKSYMQNVRKGQIERATAATKNKDFKFKINQNDYRRFIKQTKITTNGEIAENTILSIDNKVIDNESQYDGFYGITTNLEDDIEEIIKINHSRWEIEECFRTMKTEFKARPVYLTRDDRIKGHFTTCFLALLLHRIIDKTLDEKFTISEITDNLRSMNFLECKGDGYIPEYTRNDFTDTIHEKFGFRTDYEIVSMKKIKNIYKNIKN